jgi:hypothetical protein
MLGGAFTLNNVNIGTTREDLSHANIRIEVSHAQLLQDILEAIQPHEAIAEHEQDCTLSPAPANGIFTKTFILRRIFPHNSDFREPGLMFSKPKWISPLSSCLPRHPPRTSLWDP